MARARTALSSVERLLLECLLPALALTAPPSPASAQEVWGVVRLLPWSARHRLWGRARALSSADPLLIASTGRLDLETRRATKRLTAGGGKNDTDDAAEERAARGAVRDAEREVRRCRDDARRAAANADAAAGTALAQRQALQRAQGARRALSAAEGGHSNAKARLAALVRRRAEAEEEKMRKAGPGPRSPISRSHHPSVHPFHPSAPFKRSVHSFHKSIP